MGTLYFPTHASRRPTDPFDYLGNLPQWFSSTLGDCGRSFVSALRNGLFGVHGLIRELFNEVRFRLAGNAGFATFRGSTLFIAAEKPATPTTYEQICDNL